MGRSNNIFITTYRKLPSVRTDKSCKTNQNPTLPSVSFSRKAFTVRLPIKFRVNMPVVVVAGEVRGTGATGGYPGGAEDVVEYGE